MAGLLARFAFYGTVLGGRGRSGNPAFLAFISILMLVSAAVYAISLLLVRTLSRYRELAADRAGALLTGRPAQLAGALTKLESRVGDVRLD